MTISPETAELFRRMAEHYRDSPEMHERVKRGDLIDQRNLIYSEQTHGVDHPATKGVRLRIQEKLDKKIQEKARDRPSPNGVPILGQSGPEKAPSGTILTRSQLRNLPKPEPLIDGVISHLGVAVMVGAYGVGKTFVSLSMACSVGTGHSWLGRDVRKCPVLYIVGEGAYGLDSRIDAWEQGWGTKVEDDQVTFWTKPDSLAPIKTFGEPPYAPVWDEITAVAKRIQAGFVIFDTFSSLASDADETKDAPWIMRQLSDLATTINGAVMLVHHPGHADKERARGAYAIEANADEVLILAGSKESPIMELTRKKVKEGPDGDRINLRKRPVNDSVVIEHTNYQEASTTGVDASLKLLRYVFGTEPVTRSTLRKMLIDHDIPESTAYRHIGKLIEDGKLIPAGKLGMHDLYRVVPPADSSPDV